MTGIWETADTITKDRMNEKTIFQGTGSAISTLASTYSGMLAFCTSSGSGFTAEKLYQRNVANSAWLEKGSEAAEANTTPVTDDSEGLSPDIRNYAFFTLPSTEKWYIITGIEWKNGTAVAGNVVCGVDIIDANPPTLNGKPLVALGQEIAASGTNSVQRNSRISSNPIRGGTILGAWVNFNNTSQKMRFFTGGSQNQNFTETYTATPGNQNTTAWNATTTRQYIKVYYTGILQ